MAGVEVANDSVTGKCVQSLFLAALVLAGCLESNAGRGTVDLPVADCLPEQLDCGASSSWRYVECRRHALAIHAERQIVDPLVPDQYPVRGFVGVVDATLGLFVISCAKLVIDNETVLSDVQWARTFAHVTAPDSQARDGWSDYYMLELFVENETLSNRFQQDGWQTIPATIDIAPSPGGETWSIDGEGIRYDVESVQNSQGSPGDTLETRHHVLLASGIPIVADEAVVLGDSNTVAALIRAEGGMLSQLPGSGTSAYGDVSDFTGQVDEVEQISRQ